MTYFKPQYSSSLLCIPPTSRAPNTFTMEFCYFKLKAEISRAEKKNLLVNAWIFREQDFLMSVIQSQLSYPESRAGSFREKILNLIFIEIFCPSCSFSGNDSATQPFLQLSPNLFCLLPFKRREVLVNTVYFGFLERFRCKHLLLGRVVHSCMKDSPSFCSIRHGWMSVCCTGQRILWEKYNLAL